jgi:hypothetical protein
MLNEREFFVALGRYGAWLGQLIPLLFIKAGSDVKTTLIAFSFSFAFVYYLIFLVIEYALKDRLASWVLVLALCLTFRQTFYYTTAEVYHGMALSILGWSLLRQTYEAKSTKRILLWTGILAITFALPYFHQINLILWFFLIGAEYLRKFESKNYTTPALLAGVLVWFFVRVKFFSSSSYEKNKLLTLDDHLFALENFFDLPSYSYLASWGSENLGWAMAFFVTCFLYLLIKEKKLIALYIVGFFLAFIVLIVNTNFRGESNIMYENYYSLFGLFIAVGFASCFERQRISKFVSIVLIALTTHSVYAIVDSVDIFKYRTRFLQHLTAYASGATTNKFIMDAKNYPGRYASIPWALFCETALYSAIDGNEGNSTFFMTDDPNRFGENAEEAPSLLSLPWEPLWYKPEGVIDKTGIDLMNTTYKKANTARREPFTDEEFANFSKRFSLIPKRRRIRMSDEEFIVWDTYILNESDEVLHSLPEGPNATFIGYRIFRNEVEVATSRMPLEVDIPPGMEFTSGVIVDKPAGIKEGSIKFGLYTEGYGWWASSEPLRIIVN